MAYVSTLDSYTPRVIPGVTYRDEPVSHHGYGSGYEYVTPGRLAVEGTWPENSPETCDNEYEIDWLDDDGQILVCTGCGLDCT